MNNFKTIIEKIYRDYNPDKISEVTNILEKYKGKEDEMLIKISKKYDLHLEDYIMVDYLHLVKAILTKYDPVNVSSAGILLAKYTDREKGLIKNLREKYNAEFNDLIISIYDTGSHEQNQPATLKKGANTFQKTEQHTNEMRTGKNYKNRSILMGALAILIIIAAGLYFSGVFSSGKIKNNKISTSPSVNQSLVNDNKTSNTTPLSNITSPSNSTNMVTANNGTDIQGRFPFASTRLLNVSDLSGLNKQDLKIMRNEIFARHGYIFKTPEMKAYFAKQSWYHERYSDVSSMLSYLEQKNVALIKKYE